MNSGLFWVQEAEASAFLYNISSGKLTNNKPHRDTQAVNLPFHGDGDWNAEKILEWLPAFSFRTWVGVRHEP